jgi:hypothetical protein
VNMEIKRFPILNQHEFMWLLIWIWDFNIKNLML